LRWERYVFRCCSPCSISQLHELDERLFLCLLCLTSFSVLQFLAGCRPLRCVTRRVVYKGRFNAYSTGLTKLSQLRLLLNPLTSHSRTDFIVIPILTFVSPWVVDLVLLLRLYAVFPVATTRRRTICAVFAFTVSVKAARLGCDITQAVQWVPTVGQDPWTVLKTAANVQSAHSSLLKAALACDLVDHTCVQLVHLDADTQG
jgi:hypothetical protein